MKARSRLYLSIPSSPDLTHGSVSAQGLIRSPHRRHVSVMSSTSSPPEKEELGVGVNQKPYDQIHMSKLCEKREGCMQIAPGIGTFLKINQESRSDQKGR
jgi:hypothetical protein